MSKMAVMLVPVLLHPSLSSSQLLGGASCDPVKTSSIQMAMFTPTTANEILG